MLAKTSTAFFMLAMIAQVDCISLKKHHQGPWPTQDTSNPDAIYVSVDPDALHSCIEGTWASFEAGPPWAWMYANEFRKGTCKEYWNLKEDIPTHQRDPLNAPFC